MQKNIPILATGWFSSSTIERCLNSLSAIEGIKPEIYFQENASINSDKIEKVVMANPNVKGYIRFKENTMTGSQLLAFDHFEKQMQGKYIALTDADIIIYSTSVLDQIKILEKVENSGLICQRHNFLGQSSADRAEWQHYYNGAVLEAHDDYDRCIGNSCMMMMARKEDFIRMRNTIRQRDILMETMEPFRFRQQYRSPVWMDLDICRFFEIVMGKKSLTYKKDHCYELTGEERNDPNSEYIKRKGDYRQKWIKYANDHAFANCCHDKHYPDGTLKYDIII